MVVEVRATDDPEPSFAPDAILLCVKLWQLDEALEPLERGLVLERATGTSVSAYTAEHVWQPMGAEADGSWSLDSAASGFEKASCGAPSAPPGGKSSASSARSSSAG